MLFMMLAAALPFTTLPASDEQDLRCLAFLSRAASKVEGEQRRRVEGGAIWYFGRLAARSPSLDPLAQVAKILASPGYDHAAYEDDKQRCHGELQGFAGRYEGWTATCQGTPPASTSSPGK